MSHTSRARAATLLLTLGLCSGPAFVSAERQTAPAVAPVAAQSSTLPRVRLVATGGTISNRTGGRLTADELLQSMPALNRYVRAEAEQFSNVASSALSVAQWLALARRINELLAEPGLDGIVVTSGTDTLEETAYFLHLTVRSPRPVVVVGSMRNPSTLGYEGAANLLAAFRAAAEPASRGKGVLVVLNDEINSAREVTKTDALRLDTFETRGYGILGVVDSDRVVYYRDLVKRHTAKTEFDVGKLEALPRVDVLLVYQEAPGDLIRAAVDNGARGIVIAGAGAGAISGTQGDGITYALSKGVFVVTSTRAGSGRIAAPLARGDAPRPEGSREPTAEEIRRRSLRISAEDLAPLKARILLMLALATTSDGAVVQRMFTEY